MPDTPTRGRWQDLQARVGTSNIAVSAEATFGLNLLRGIVDQMPGQNVFISPLSVFLALQMAGNGADGSTRSAMWKALALPGSNTAVLNASTEALQRILKDRGFA